MTLRGDVALRVTLQNTDKLIDTEKLSPTSNTLYQILQQIVSAVRK